MKLTSLNVTINSKQIIIEHTVDDFISIRYNAESLVHRRINSNHYIDFDMNERYKVAENVLTFIYNRTPTWFEVNRFVGLINEICWI